LVRVEKTCVKFDLFRTLLRLQCAVEFFPLCAKERAKFIFLLAELHTSSGTLQVTIFNDFVDSQ